MVHAVTVALAVLGVAGLASAVALLLVGLAALVGVRAPLDTLRSALRGWELWLAFAASTMSTAGSLFFTSGWVNFYPGEIGWYERICMYPLTVTTLLAALAADRRAARYLLTFPVVGFSLSFYGLLLENGWVTQPQSCVLSGPGGCATKWIDEFGFVTIPLLSMTAFALIAAFLALAAFDREAAADGPSRSTATVALGVAGAAVIAVAIAIVVAASAGTSTSSSASTTSTATTPVVAAGDPARGEAVFKSSGCGACHTLAAAGATGKVARPDLGALKLSEASIVSTVRNGATTTYGASMSPFKGVLSATQIADVAAFVHQAESA